MSQTFSIDLTVNLVVFKPKGLMRFIDYVATLSAYHRHPEFKLGQRLFVDLSGIQGFEPDYDKLASQETINEVWFSGKSNETKMVLYSDDLSIVNYLRKVNADRNSERFVPRFFTNDVAAGLKFLGIDPSDTTLVQTLH